MAYGKKTNVAELLLSRDEFGGAESSTQSMDMDTHGMADRPHHREDTRAKQMGRMWGDVSNNDARIVADAKVDPDPTRSLVVSPSQYVGETYPYWTDTIRRVAIGVILMVQTRAVNIHGRIHIIHLAQGNKYMRPHAGKTYLYDNGAFQLYRGIMRESVLPRCRRYAECLEDFRRAMA